MLRLLVFLLRFDHRFVECFDVELVILFADAGCKLQHVIVFIVSFG